jgi:hypothetical protein
MHNLKRDGWRKAARFASYSCQMDKLGLHPAQSPPCWILTEDEADEILAEGYIPSSLDGSDVSNCPGARLLKQMLALGVSPYDPDPLRAIAEAERQR